MNSSLLLAIAIAVLSVTQCHASDATERFGFGGPVDDDWYDYDISFESDYDYEDTIDCAGTACDADTEFCIMNGLSDDKTPRFECAKKMEVCHDDVEYECTGWWCDMGRSDETKNEERAGRMKKQVRSRKTKNEERAGRMKKQVRSRKTKNEE